MIKHLSYVLSFTEDTESPRRRFCRHGLHHGFVTATSIGAAGGGWAGVVAILGFQCCFIYVFFPLLLFIIIIIITNRYHYCDLFGSIKSSFTLYFHYNIFVD